MTRLTNREVDEIVAGRDPIFNPKAGDVVRSQYPSIGERHVTHVTDCGISYERRRPGLLTQQGYCLPVIWTKWCRSHRVVIVERADGVSEDPTK
jgi:hypothetical protein